MKSYPVLKKLRCRKTKKVFAVGESYTPPTEAEELKLLEAGYLKGKVAKPKEDPPKDPPKDPPADPEKAEAVAQYEQDVAEFGAIETKADLVEFVETLEIPVDVELLKDELFAAVAKYFEDNKSQLGI